jgi:hypothetical protein
MKTILSIVIALCAACSVLAGNADSLFFIAPRSATGYSGLSISKPGENLPAWTSPTQADKAKSAAAATGSGSLIAIGESNQGVSITFLPYPDKIITMATTFAFFKTSPTSTLTPATAALDSFPGADSILNANKAPSSVNEAGSLSHFRASTGLRFNTWPIMKPYDFLPFPVNPFIGAGVTLDASFGSTKIKPADTIPPSDTGLGAFDSTYHQFFLDAGFSIPMGIEIFPLKKTDIPILKDMGISFVYTIYSLFRTVAVPGLTANPYKDYLNNLSNNSSNNNNNNSSNTSTSSPSDSSSGGSGGGKNNGNPFWTGWSKVTTKSEYRISLEFMF